MLQLKSAVRRTAIAVVLACTAPVIHAVDFEIPFRRPVEDWTTARAKVAGALNYDRYDAVLSGDQTNLRKIIADRKALLENWMIAFPTDNKFWPSAWGNGGGVVVTHDSVTPDLLATINTPDHPTTRDLYLAKDDVSMAAKNWVTSFRIKHINYIQEAAYLSKLTGDMKYAEWASQQFDYYAATYYDWYLPDDPKEKRYSGYPRLWENTMDESEKLYLMIDAARVLKSLTIVRTPSVGEEAYVTPARFQSWMSGFFKPSAEDTIRSYQSVGSLGLVQLGAVANIALLANDGDTDTLWQRAFHGDTGADPANGKNMGLHYLVQNGMTTDGYWYTGAMTYNGRAAIYLADLVREASLMTQDTKYTDELLPFAAAAAKMLRSQLIMRFPYEKRYGGDEWSSTSALPNPNDGLATLSPGLYLFAQVSRVLPTTWGQRFRYDNSNFLYDSLVDPALFFPSYNTTNQYSNTGTFPSPYPLAYKPLPEVKSLDMRATQMALLRQPPSEAVGGDGQTWQVFTHFGQLQETHAHGEALNYEAYFGNTPFTHDPGSAYDDGYSYASNAVAHNVPLLDAKGPKDHHIMLGRLSNWQPDTTMTVEQDHYIDETNLPAASAARTFTINGKTLTDAVTLNISPDSAATLRYVGLPLYVSCKVKNEGADATTKSPVKVSPLTQENGIWKLLASRTLAGTSGTVSSAVFNLEKCGADKDKMFSVKISFPGSGVAHIFDVPDSSTPAATSGARREMIYLELPVMTQPDSAVSTTITTEITAQ